MRYLKIHFFILCFFCFIVTNLFSGLENNFSIRGLLRDIQSGSIEVLEFPPIWQTQVAQFKRDYYNCFKTLSNVTECFVYSGKIIQNNDEVLFMILRQQSLKDFRDSYSFFVEVYKADGCYFNISFLLKKIVYSEGFDVGGFMNTDEVKGYIEQYFNSEFLNQIKKCRCLEG